MRDKKPRTHKCKCAICERRLAAGVAEDEGFEPPWDCSQMVFKTTAL